MKKSSRNVIQMVVHVILSYPPGKFSWRMLFRRHLKAQSSLSHEEKQQKSHTNGGACDLVLPPR